MENEKPKLLILMSCFCFSSLAVKSATFEELWKFCSGFTGNFNAISGARDHFLVARLMVVKFVLCIL